MLDRQLVAESNKRSTPTGARGPNSLRDMPCSRLEWQLSRSRLLSYLIDVTVQKPRRAYHFWKWKRRQRPQSLSNFESKAYSQYGEDGIIAEIFHRIGEHDRFFIEFGIEDGSECCSRNLILNRGWRGVLIDGDSKHVAAATRLYAEHSTVRVACNFITVE